ncbi:DUF433 domain-containing protein [Candidatus Glomeribacter gigasporarum]|uniref:DUF433 domain-containing protein n=1 Tax=Candidatus Glomeribacter gigasporarum TaxID=132144 RepID=UPI0009DA39C2
MRWHSLPAAVLFEHLADGMTLDQILESYPTLSREAALQTLHEAERLFERKQTAA